LINITIFKSEYGLEIEFLERTIVLDLPFLSTPATTSRELIATQIAYFTLYPISYSEGIKSDKKFNRLAKSTLDTFMNFEVIL
jgi:hypothetical protein